MKKKNFSEMFFDDLKKEEQKMRQELSDLNLSKFSSQVEKTHMFKKLKKDIARVMTFCNQKQLSDIGR